MKIETAHKILIAAAVAFFGFFAVLEGGRYLRLRDGTAGLLALGGLVAAAGFAVYLRWYVKSLGTAVPGGRQ